MAQPDNLPDLDKLMSEFDVNLAAAIADIVRDQNQIDEAKRESTTTCTHCRKERGSQLRSCTRCKAARYCDEKCQRADYKARHRRECAEFVHPPRSRSFRTRPVGEEKYPHDPVFARGHDEGVGCWVGAGIRMDCQLGQLARTIYPLVNNDAMQMARTQLVFSQVHKLGPASRRNLCTIRICIQNRRKDNAAVLIFGSRAQVVTRASSTDEVLRGRVDSYDNVVTFTTSNGQRLVAVGVPKDPWSYKPRVHVGHINGQATHEPPYPPGMQDADEGIVALNPGDFAIAAIQFRVGDEETINMDWQALRCLDHVVVPFMPWDRVSRPAALAAAIPPAYTLPSLASAAGKLGPRSSAVKHLRMSFDQDAITAYYWDYIEHGEEAFMRTHHGEAHMNMSHSMAKNAAALAQMHLHLEGHTAEEAIDIGREIGLGDFIERSLQGKF